MPRQSGFTLVELLIAIAISSVVVMMAVHEFAQWQVGQKARSIADGAKAIALATSQYYRKQCPFGAVGPVITLDQLHGSSAILPLSLPLPSPWGGQYSITIEGAGTVAARVHIEIVLDTSGHARRVVMEDRRAESSGAVVRWTWPLNIFRSDQDREAQYELSTFGNSQC